MFVHFECCSSVDGVSGALLNRFAYVVESLLGAVVLRGYGLFKLPQPMPPRHSCGTSGADVLGETSMASTTVSNDEPVS